MATDARGIIEQLGDPAEVNRELARFRKSAQLLSSQRARLIERYPEQWVAVYDGKVRAHGRTLEATLKQLDEDGIPRAHTAIGFVSENDQTMIV
jgi:hypothetical protein